MPWSRWWLTSCPSCRTGDWGSRGFTCPNSYSRRESMERLWGAKGEEEFIIGWALGPGDGPNRWRFITSDAPRPTSNWAYKTWKELLLWVMLGSIKHCFQVISLRQQIYWGCIRPTSNWTPALFIHAVHTHMNNTIKRVEVDQISHVRLRLLSQYTVHSLILQMCFEHYTSA